MVKLNPEQRQAVEHGEGPLLVIAGPGSGKTRVITQRIVYLLKNVRDLEPGNVLALTFTDKAAEGMKRRVGEALPGLRDLPPVSTFHAFCFHVLRERQFDRRLLDQVDVWIFLRRRMARLGLESYRKLAEPGAFLHDLNEFFSRCQDELVSPDDFDGYVRKLEREHERVATPLDPGERRLREEELLKRKELARVFRTSRQLLEDSGQSNLGSLIPETVQLFDREPQVLARFRDQFRYVLVDEFQDTNYAQVELLRRLVAPPLNITAVGDDDQAIYRFRGAAQGAFEMFGRAFPGHRTATLSRNYRSTRRILRVADAVIAKNQRSVAKPKLKSEKEEGSAVYLLSSTDYRSEAAWIAGEIERLCGRGMPWGAMAVLYRAHHHRDPLVKEFRRRKIPFTVRGLSVLSTVILRDLVAYLRLVNSPHDNISLTRTLLAPRWRFPEELALEIRKQAARENCSLFDVLQAKQRSLLDRELENTGWLELSKLLRELKRFSEQASVGALFDRLVARLELVFLPDDPDQTYLNAFRTFLATWEEKSESRRLPEFMDYFRWFLEAGGKIEVPEEKQVSSAVQLMTVHAAKGLEFPVVFVLSVAPRRFPHPDQRPVIEFPDALRKGPQPPPNIHLQEERRLFFVGMTRAEERLYISSVSKSEKKVSEFVDDLVSDAAVAQCDIERVQAPEFVREAHSPAPPPRKSSFEREAQPRLFDGSIVSGPVHAPVEEWAARPPALTSDGKLRLSASALEDYRSCPLKFKFSHYLKVPTGPQAALTFGNVMHQCIRHYFELSRRGEPRWEDLEKIYRHSWRSAGFEDSYQEETYKKAGLEQLRGFVEHQRRHPIPADQVRMEEHFSLDLGDAVLEGRIDQIHPLGRPGDAAVELIDYKTGRPRTQRDVDKSLQLSVYALAARRQLKLNPVRLTFYHLANNQTVSTVRTEKDLEQTVKEIQEVAAQIRSLLFAPTPGFVCKWCDFVAICPAHEELG